jgi:hypothetical protein
LKKFLPYVIGAAALLVLIVLAVNTPLNKKRKLDERVTLRHRDKIPYGTYVAHQLLSKTFSNAHVTFDKSAPDYWTDINTDTSGQVVFLLCNGFDPEHEELENIMQFVQAGNDVFLITTDFGWDTEQYLQLRTAPTFAIGEDSLQIALRAPFATAASYQYPGKKWDTYFTKLNAATTVQLGNNSDGYTNFIQLQSGRGRLFVHLAPLAFSNYFLLHKNNIRYFQNVLSLIPDGVTKIVWNEYYLTRHQKKEAEPNVLSVLWQHQPFRWALVTVVLTLLLHVASAMRRSQRMIPFYTKPANDSLDFVRTMGRLYCDRSDHHNLAKKMAAYFLEQVRSRYKIVTLTLDETFVAELHAKTGYDSEELKKIVDFIQYINTYTFITEQELARFYGQLNLFYKTSGTIV